MGLAKYSQRVAPGVGAPMPPFSRQPEPGLPAAPILAGCLTCLNILMLAPLPPNCETTIPRESLRVLRQGFDKLNPAAQANSATEKVLPHPDPFPLEEGKPVLAPLGESSSGIALNQADVPARNDPADGFFQPPGQGAPTGELLMAWQIKVGKSGAELLRQCGENRAQIARGAPLNQALTFCHNVSLLYIALSLHASYT